MARKNGELTSPPTPADLIGRGKPYRLLFNLWWTAGQRLIANRHLAFGASRINATFAGIQPYEAPSITLDHAVGALQ